MARRTLYKAASCTGLLLLLVCFSAVSWDTSAWKRGLAAPRTLGRGDLSRHPARHGRALLTYNTKECRDIHNIKGTAEKCQFIEETNDCNQQDGFFPYNYFVYCKLGHAIPQAMTILIIWWLFAFIGLAVCADDFFCPSLVVISKTLHLSPNVAGVTFLAFGNGAPDFFSALTSLGKGGASGLGVGGLFGAGMFVTTVVVGTISVVKPFKAMQRPFLRDVIFYMVAVYWVFFVLWREKMYLFETIGLVCLYVCYVITVIVSGAIYNRQKQAAEAKFGQSIMLKEVTRINSHSLNGSLMELSSTVHQTFDTSTQVAFITESTETTVSETLPFRRENSMGNLGVVDAFPSAPTCVLNTVDEPISGLDTMEEENVSETLPAWWRQLLAGLNPINLEDWADMAWYGKVYEVFKSPIMVAITLTCPIVSYDEEVNHNWNKYLQCLQMFCAPVLCCMLTKVGFNSIVGGFQVYMLMLIVGTCLSLLIFFTSKPEVKPVYHEVFGYVAFVISLNWIYVIANEIVAILETFGVVFNISNAILGLTLLAWGNSIGDWISNTVMARQGFARMGFAACFGAPLFNLCLGFGIPLMIQMISKQETSIKVTLTPVTMVLGMFLLTSVCMSLVFLPILKFKVNRYYGIILLLLYIVFLITILLTETKVILGGFEIPKVPKPDL